MLILLVTALPAMSPVVCSGFWPLPSAPRNRNTIHPRGSLILLSHQGSAHQKPFHASRLVMPELSSKGGEQEAVERG